MGLILSEDGGATWTQLSAGAGGPVDFHTMTVSRADPKTMYGLFARVQLSRDNGASWTVAGPGPDRVIDLAASPTAPDVVYAGTVGGLMRSELPLMDSPAYRWSSPCSNDRLRLVRLASSAAAGESICRPKPLRRELR